VTRGGLIFVALLLVAGCNEQAIDEPAAAFDQPPAWPGYQWSLNGTKVGTDVIATAAGPEHCGWQTATFLTLGWPPGRSSSTAAGARQYIRDPKNAIGTPYLKTPLQLRASLPPDAVPTGLTYRGLQIYTSPTDQDVAIYVTGWHITERWPRSDPMTLCE
jgi:hypothetical protein